MELSERVLKLEFWRNGNGSPGAESRITECEKKIEAVSASQNSCLTEEETKAMVDACENKMLTAVKEAMKVKYAGLKAFAPYFAGICSIAVAIIVILKS